MPFFSSVKRFSGLFEIYMKSRADFQFPISWKKSQVTAVFKKGNRLDENNYRPISLLKTKDCNRPTRTPLVSCDSDAFKP